ncbi:MAG: HDOD domain-containing protein [Burkholderiales bacterium]
MQEDLAAFSPDIEEAAKNIRLPACPAILTRLLREMRADEPDFVKVAKLIGSDVSLSGAMLKTVNSPFYGLRAKVASVHQALNVIGLRNTTQLVTGLLLRDTFQSAASDKMQAYWQSTLKIALLNACLARNLGVVDREEAYTFALFRDCGVLAMMVDLPQYEPTLPGAAASGRRVIEIENERHGVNHAAIGYYLTKSWLVPAHLCEAVLLHHDYDAFHDGAAATTPSSLKHVALGIASEWLYLEKVAGRTCPQWPHASAFALQTLGTAESDLLQIVENVAGL